MSGGRSALAQSPDAGTAGARLLHAARRFDRDRSALPHAGALPLSQSRSTTQDLDAVGRAIVVENKWRAQRYGVHGTFVTKDGAVTVADMLDRAIEETAADAEALGCAAEIRRCRAIVDAGTSADAQLAVYEAQRSKSNREQALRAVAEWIAGATLR